MRARATWLLGVLFLLAGLFAMHGMQAANGDSHAMPMAASASAHAMPHDTAPMPELAPHAGHGHDAAMCLALLGLTLLALALTRAPWLDLVRDPRRAVRLPRARRRPPSRDPPVYLRLCVFRL